MEKISVKGLMERQKHDSSAVSEENSCGTWSSEPALVFPTGDPFHRKPIEGTQTLATHQCAKRIPRSSGSLNTECLQPCAWQI